MTNSSSTRGRVLIVDDDRKILDLLVELLELEGYEVSAATDGAQALEAAFSFFDPDVVVSDVVMPVVDGFELCRRLKEDPRTLFTVEREISVPGMDAPPEVLEAALAQNEAHEAYRKGLYRVVSENFSTGFAGRMFRQNLIDHKTAELGNAMREQQAEIKRQKIEKKKRAAAIERKAARLGIPTGVMSRRPGAEEGIEQMTAAMRNLGLLEAEKGTTQQEAE